MVSSLSDSVLALPDLERLCVDALRAAGASPDMARTLAAATVAAERRGKSGVGAAHLLDYLDALRAGRLHGAARPHLEHVRAAVLTVDADGGTAQLAFDHAADELVEAARSCGVAVLSTRNSYPAGELAHYAVRLAEAGMIALVCGNSPALMAVHGATDAVTGTNPLAFALPHRTGPRVIDQATSATAFVAIREAARRGEPIPEGWALDAQGRPTTDAVAALTGVLLPFGGIKGGSIAMMVELLAAMSGGSFSLDSAPFDSGGRSPRLGMLVAAIDPSAFATDYPERAEAHLLHLRDRFGIDIGRRRPPRTHVDLPEDVLRALRAR
jgi:(2R)-3-sulfolactate dehydrogenase (NADP+)